MFASFVTVTEDGDHWRLLHALIYHGNTDRFVVPAGFRTDFASVPAWATWLLPRTGKHNRAAVLHDALVRDPNVSRKDADGIFLRVLRELDVPEWRARLMYAGVRAGAYLKGSP